MKTMVNIKRQNIAQTFANAFNGISIFFSSERNGRIHAGAALLVIITASLLHVSATEWLALIFCIAMVLSLEMINAAIEQLCNLVHPEYHPLVKIIKDIAAAAVLCASIFSAITGLIIFLPKIIVLL